MWRFVLNRLAKLVLALLVSSFVIFASLFLAPGSPLTTLSGGRTLSPAATAALERQYHLNDSFLHQYWDWLSGALHGNLGVSLATREPVSAVIREHAGITIGLVVYAGLIIIVAGIGLGILSGLRKGAIDSTVLAATSMTTSAGEVAVLATAPVQDMSPTVR